MVQPSPQRELIKTGSRKRGHGSPIHFPKEIVTDLQMAPPFMTSSPLATSTIIIPSSTTITSKPPPPNELKLPAPPPKTVGEVKLKLKEAMRKREMSIHVVDEIHTLEKRLRLEEQKKIIMQEGSVTELENERKRRKIAEAEVQELK